MVGSAPYENDRRAFADVFLHLRHYVLDDGVACRAVIALGSQQRRAQTHVLEQIQILCQLIFDDLEFRAVDHVQRLDRKMRDPFRGELREDIRYVIGPHLLRFDAAGECPADLAIGVLVRYRAFYRLGDVPKADCKVRPVVLDHAQ